MNYTPVAIAQNWGTRSFLKEHFFEPGLSPEDAVLRIKQTAEGLHNMREMLETMSWRYVMFYIRLKQNYLEQDLKNALTTLPQNQRKDYVKTANQLVENMAEIPTIDQETGEFGSEPTETMMKTRAGKIIRPNDKNKNMVYFGQNVVWNWRDSSAKGDGKVLKVGDPVYVLRQVSSPAEAAA